MSELKPCPFCGARTAFVKYLGEYDHAVKCRQCSSWGPDAPTKADAVTRWNDCAARSPEPTKTLRDEFAMAALPGVVGWIRASGREVLSGGVEVFAAEVAYGIADAMMKEREKADD